MRKEIIDRLIEFREFNGLSIKDLASRLSIDEKTIISWENGEVEPSLDDLGFLAKLYGVKLSDLIDSDEAISNLYKEENESVHISLDGIHVKDKQGKKVDISFKDGLHVTGPNSKGVHIGPKAIKKSIKSEIRKRGMIMGILTSLTFIVSLIVYLLLGFLLPNNEGWMAGWVIFTLVPIIPSLYDAIVSKNPSRFAMPVFAIGLYCLLGLTGPKIWHPTWVIFFSIPFFYVLCDLIEKIKRDY